MEHAIELVRETDSPRAIEVFSNMLKQNAEIAEKLMDLQKKRKDIERMALPSDGANITQNNVFVGSSADLQRMIHSKLATKLGGDIEHE
jgi:hypothetical protein